ncbi:hypothetical protein JCM6882_004236 [Rhodosporidiobolus microsporus]
MSSSCRPQPSTLLPKTLFSPRRAMPTNKRRLPSPEAQPFNERIYPVAAPHPKKPKKSDPDYGLPPPEKREKLFKKSCPVATQERADRVYSQRFFCVDRTRTSDITEEFKVLGSTGNQYTVKIGKQPTCNCPDGSKGNTCKHRLFVLLKRLLQVPKSSNLWYQSGLLTSELAAIFAHARPAPRTMLDERVSKAFRIATGAEKPEEGASAGGGGVVKKRIPQAEDSCPICYEDFTPGSETGLVFCLSVTGCGNPLHSECFANWASTCKPTTCPLCREKWVGADATASASGSAQAGPSYSEGYANFALQAGISTKRDTSSYYRGPRRGERYDGGWGRYGEDDYGEWDDEY